MTERTERSTEHSASLIAVGLGGGLGTLARAGLETLWPHDAAHLPGATLAVNLTGALLLGILTGFLSAVGPDEGGRRLLRLAAGTGLMGGLTTHSTYIVEVVRLQQHGRALMAPAYLFGSLAAGIAAAAIGLLLGGRVGRTLRTRRTPRTLQTQPTRRRPHPQGSSS